MRKTYIDIDLGIESYGRDLNTVSYLEVQRLAFTHVCDLYPKYSL
jgi:hypothetical protein